MELSISPEAADVLQEVGSDVQRLGCGAVLAALKFDTTTGALVGVAPVKHDDKYVRITIRTADGFTDYFDYCASTVSDKPADAALEP